MKKIASFFGGFTAIAIIFLTLVFTTGCGSKSGHRDEKIVTEPVTLGGELVHSIKSGNDTIYTGEILSWSYDSRTGEVSALFSGNGDRIGIQVKGTNQDVYGLLSQATDSIGIKHAGGAKGSVMDYYKIAEFYSGPKYVDGQTAYFEPDMIEIFFSNGSVSDFNITSFVGDYKSVDIQPTNDNYILEEILRPGAHPLIGVKYQKDGWEFMNITTRNEQ